MQSVRVKTPAKLNLTLNITGREGGYHMLDSVVVTIDLFDEVIVKKRKDERVNIFMRGMGSETIPPEKNNAFRAAEMFVRKYEVSGADIIVNKNIPMGAGLGGSSSDAAGALCALSKLYGIKDGEGIGKIADAVGSDTRYLLRGGYARLRGRGNIIEPLKSPLKLNFFIIVPSCGVSTSACYARYDALPDGERNNSSLAAAALAEGDFEALCKSFYNALYAPSRELCPDVERALYEALSFNPKGAAMTGSGSAVFAAFESDMFCRWAESRYAGSYSAFCAKTFIPKNSTEV